MKRIAGIRLAEPSHGARLCQSITSRNRRRTQNTICQRSSRNTHPPTP
ncbi:hypothetical protein p1B205 (plasmid) [Aromatoleum aromaticum EbN1]|uniref:Uncharacterized protein n=1 Tax=Aromatoleum aromaticum (strain DSM 19018 / LMG 30748 / EbN1) TaxID=76114 RepID=Q5NX15_AROAE|nr:hypothetical protein p1B205 [Aromatoleum aromaticum EbN1]